MNQRVCFLTESFTPELVNGALNQISLVGNRLSKKGVQTLIIANKVLKSEPFQEKNGGVKIVRVLPTVGPRRYRKYFMIFFAFLKLFELRNEYDLLIICNLRVLGVLGVPVKRILKKKILLRAESCGELDGRFATQFEKQISSLKLKIAQILTKLRNLLILNADGYLSISTAITSELKAVGVERSHIYQITNGIDLNRFHPVAIHNKQRLKINLGLSPKKAFIFTGRLAKGKGLRFLLRVWSRVRALHKDAQLILVGSGEGWSQSCEEELKSYVKKYKMYESVIFTGRVNNVQDYLNAGDFFIFPSQSEGLGLSLIEAMACELPCIATRVGGILDIIDHKKNGILVEYGNEEALFFAMDEMLNTSEEAEKLGKNGRMKVKSHFDIEKIIDEYISLFSKMIEY